MGHRGTQRGTGGHRGTQGDTWLSGKCAGLLILRSDTCMMEGINKNILEITIAQMHGDSGDIEATIGATRKNERRNKRERERESEKDDAEKI